ncbi:hypothetical protein AB0P12_01605 [Streptomyces subrutilus]|uniref:hypothetical protein n=1 Tax=Streptomyces subrutilus TaxID=36818 RepID=UPI0033D81EE4
MNGTRALAAAAGALGTLLLAGCGIAPTGVIEAGSAARVVVPGSAGPVLYFIAPEGDRLVPYPLMADGYRLPPGGLVAQLLAGPGSSGRSSGLGTELPRMQIKPLDATAVSWAAPDGVPTVTARLPFAVGGLSALGRGQLVCTLAFAGEPDTLSRVALIGTDTALPADRCDVRR